MARRIEIRPLVPADDRSAFSCGEPRLDRFFQHYAGQNQFKLNLSVTYVAVEEKDIVGFATVAVGSIEKQDLPSKRLRQRLPAYPLPILRLARLGVGESAQGSGVGYPLLRHVLQLALTQREALGCVGVVTDAKPDAASFYDKLGFIALEGVRQGRLHGGPTPMFLDIRTLAKAQEG